MAALWRQAAGIAVLALVLGFGVNALRPDGIPLVGDWSAEARFAGKAGESMVVSLAEAKQLFAGGRAVFADARSAGDYAAGHIQGAVSLPWQQVDEYFAEAAERLDSSGEIIAYCDGESCELSHNLAKFLKEMGYADVRVLVNGWSLWRLEGLPTE